MFRYPFLSKCSFLLCTIIFANLALAALDQPPPAAATNTACLELLSAGGSNLEALKVLSEPRFWLDLKLEKLVADIDPTAPTTEETPDHIFVAFGKNPAIDQDRKDLQKILEALGHLFLEKDDEYISRLAARLPNEARGQVNTDLFRAHGRGPAPFKIIQTFVVNKMLTRGSPAEASNLILSDTQLPSARNRGLVNPAIWKQKFLRPALTNLSATVMHPIDTAKIPIAKWSLFWERVGISDALPALLRPTLEHYFIYVRQYGTLGFPSHVFFADLPEKYQTIALDAMNSAQKLPSAIDESVLRQDPIFLDSNQAVRKPAPESGTWSSRFIELLTKFGHDHRAQILKSAGADAHEPVTTDQAETLIQGSLSPLNYWVYRQGIEYATSKWQQDLQKERTKIQNILYSAPEQAYQELMAVNRGADLSKAKIIDQAKHWNISDSERDRLSRTEISKSEAEWDRFKSDAITKFATSVLCAHFLADLVGLEINPKFQELFDNEPAILLAAVNALIDAEKEQTEEKRKLNLEIFKNSLRPEVREALFSINSSSYPLGSRIIESYLARNWKERALRRIAEVSKIITVFAVTGVVLTGFQTFKQKITPPATTEASVWRLTHVDIDPAKMLTDAKFRQDKNIFMTKALTDGLSPIDERVLSEFINDTDITKLPEPLQETFRKMRDRDPNDPLYKDFDGFHNWNGSYRNTVFGREAVPLDIKKNRPTWLNFTLDVMRIMSWKYSDARGQYDANLEKTVAESVAADVKKLNEERKITPQKKRTDTPPAITPPASETTQTNQ